MHSHTHTHTVCWAFNALSAGSQSSALWPVSVFVLGHKCVHTRTGWKTNPCRISIGLGISGLSELRDFGKWRRGKVDYWIEMSKDSQWWIWELTHLTVFNRNHGKCKTAKQAEADRYVSHNVFLSSEKVFVATIRRRLSSQLNTYSTGWIHFCWLLQQTLSHAYICDCVVLGTDFGLPPSHSLQLCMCMQCYWVLAVDIVQSPSGLIWKNYLSITFLQKKNTFKLWRLSTSSPMDVSYSWFLTWVLCGLHDITVSYCNVPPP